MRFSKGGIKTLRETNEASKNADLLIKGNFIEQLASGIYTMLPLGSRVLSKIEQIVREEMENIGGVELLMPALHPKENWEKTNRWKLPVMFKTKSAYGGDYGLGWTHEEIITPIAKNYISSYKDLPLYLFQIQTKFRDEPRAKSGLLRTREFSMKDLYSFHKDEDDLEGYYDVVKKAYFKIFERCGIRKDTVLTYASGGDFSKYSHEFQTLSEVGEDTIFLCKKCNIGINKEIAGKIPACPECGSKNMTEEKAIEVGNIFKLGKKFSKPFNLKYKDKNGKENLVVMGCYGIGPGRIMGTVVENSNDSKGIIWPIEIAPHSIHLIDLDGEKKEASEIYEKLKKSGHEILWDDRDESAGVKFADADLIGIPLRVVVSEKTIKSKKIEIKYRNKQKEKLISLKNLLKK